MRPPRSRTDRPVPAELVNGAKVSAAATVELRKEPPDAGPAVQLTPTERALVADLVADGLSIQDKFCPEPLYKRAGKGHYASDTVEEMRRARAPKGRPS